MKHISRTPWALGLALLGVVACVGAAMADTPAAPVPDKGDTAWMLVSSALVLMMSIPGLALFYGGLVRTKNALSILMQVFAIVSMVGILWVLYGYSISLGDTGGSFAAYIGGLGKIFLKGVDANAVVPTFSNGVVIPELAYMVFQMTFAMHHAGPHHRRSRRAHEVPGGDAVRPVVGDLHLFPHCPHGMGGRGAGRHSQRGESAGRGDG